MQFRQKLAYMALGGVLVLAGHVLPGLVVGSATAQSGLQDAEFNEIRAQKIVMEKPGEGQIMLALSKLGPVVGVMSPNGEYTTMMQATDWFATVVARGEKRHTVAAIESGVLGPSLSARADEQKLAELSLNGRGGVLNMYDSQGDSRVAMGVGEYGGRVEVYGKGSNDPRVALGVNEYGNGGVGTWDKNGYRQ